jgi:Mce-associated membrane protein
MSTTGVRGSGWPVTSVIVAVILAGFAAIAGVKAHDLRASQVPENLALTDSALTSQVNRQIGGAVSTIFSYSYTDPGATRRAAQRLLTGTAIRQYDRLFTLVEQKAPAEKLVLRTKVTDIGVELLTASQARLLVFVNQQDQADSGQAVYSGAMFAVTAVLRQSRWFIADINTFTTSG